MPSLFLAGISSKDTRVEEGVQFMNSVCVSDSGIQALTPSPASGRYRTPVVERA
jgi:hypothetical protein